MWPAKPSASIGIMPVRVWPRVRLSMDQGAHDRFRSPGQGPVRLGTRPACPGLSDEVFIGVLNRGQRTVGTDTLPDQVMPFTRLERRDRFSEAMALHDMLHCTSQRKSGYVDDASIDSHDNCGIAAKERNTLDAGVICRAIRAIHNWSHLPKPATGATTRKNSRRSNE